MPMPQNHSYNKVVEGSAAQSSKVSLLSGAVACVCIVVYLGAIVFAGVRVYTGVIERRALASREFARLADFSASLGSGGMYDPLFEQSVEEEFSRLKTLQGVIFSSALGNYTALERNKGKVIIWNELKETPDFKPQFGLSKEPFSKPIQIGNQMITFRAVYTYIDYERLIAILKRTLLVVLATLCLALFTLIFQFLMANPPAPAHSKEGDLMSRDTAEFFHTKEAEEEEQERAPRARAPAEEEPPQEMPHAPPAQEETGGLYAARSYIGQEGHGKDRLAAELKRCAAFEQDLVFMAVELHTSLPPDDKEFRLLADEAVKFFLRRDLIFEKGGQGIAVIIPGIDLDQGFTKSEKLLVRVESKYAEAFGREAKLYIGLSSRAERDIEADRIIFEASGALKKAWEDPSSPIVAFRSDPEKYRDFMAAQNKSLP
ncbi:MAG: hypothetical protein LBD13_07065 [Spirochaetaceae bacterium]|jgi:hypothetical protein|nr:hypothetical protein [Spirochaetaceae bacterium]